MVPTSFNEYFSAAATAAAALIGLLFVAVALRPHTVFGASAPAAGRALASSAFAALVNAFFVSLLAVLPDQNVGYPAIVLAAISVIRTVQLHHALGFDRTRALLTVLSFTTYGAQAGIGIALLAHSRSIGLIQSLAYIVIGAFAVALARAWALLGGQHVAEE